MTDVSLRAVPLVPNPVQIEDLTLLEEVASRTAGVSRLEMCIQCGSHTTDVVCHAAGGNARRGA
jgi:hypothetical protein